MLSFLMGSLTMLPFYGLVRLWFGVRMAIIATSCSPFRISRSRKQAGVHNSTVPFFLTAGFYFLFKGFRSRRMLDFVAAGYLLMGNLYFYNGGQIAPILLLALLGYLFLLMPLVKLPGVYKQVRNRQPSDGRVRALGRAAKAQVRGVTQYAGQITFFSWPAFVWPRRSPSIS